MNKYLKNLMLLLIVISSCKPNEPVPQEEDKDRRSQFVGTYKVSNISEPYFFTINKLDTLGQTWVKVNNFANMLDMKFKMNQNESPSNIIVFSSYFPIIDTKYKHKWDFGISSNDTILDNCLLINEQLKVYFRLRNTPWYGIDDTSYINKYELHVGVKQ